jgi:hypothetical protein
MEKQLHDAVDLYCEVATFAQACLILTPAGVFGLTAGTSTLTGRRGIGTHHWNKQGNWF